YRPKNFAGVAVQSHVSDTLRGAIARGRVAHGYLLCGPRGTGKTTLARVLAMALNCENRGSDGEPCGVCTSCHRIWSGSSSLDVIEIDAASNRGVDDARELRERAMYAPSGEDRYKVYIVDEAHMLTREAWNALLKILEEPPPRVVFVFATTEPQKIAQTAAPVLSRLQRFDLKRISIQEIIKRLETVLESEKITATGESLAMIARAADGSMRDALSLTDQVISIGEGGITADRVREALGLIPEDEYLAIIDIIAKRRAAEVFDTVRKLADGGVDFGVFLSGLGDMLRAQLAVVLGGKTAGVSPHALEILESHRDEFAPGDILRMLSILTGIEPQFRRSGQQQLLVEMMLVRFALLDRSVSIEEVLQTLGGGGGSTPKPANAPARTRAAEPKAEPRSEPHRAGATGSKTAHDVPATPVVTSPAPPLRVTPPGGQSAMPDWKAEFDQTASSGSRERLTTEAVREERLKMLRAQDPVLDAAVRELDLDLLD
ncbi:MAG TPA: DNA polymerase III subunit gamma/tau, partial [Gemmatimonadaceae bacterium]|nr:DNA polymerase III subunit gamma/tau [Gemmatimonadaceae bacterium]